MINSKLYFRKSYQNRQGQSPIYLRLNHRGKVTDVTLNIMADPVAWNEKKLRIKATDPDHAIKNKLLDHYELKARQIKHDHELHNKPLTIPELKRLIKDTGYGNECFYAYAEKVLKEREKDHAANTQRGMRANIKKLQQFRPSLTLSQIDLDVIQGFDRYLRHDRKNNDNTVRRAMKTIRTICLHAFQRGLIPKNPFVNYKIGEIVGNRESLTENEVNKLEELYESGSLDKAKQNVLRYFLFACYTGTAFVDLKNLQRKNIVEKMVWGEKQKFLSYTRQKTKTLAYLPVLREAERLIPSMPHFNQKQKKQMLFRVICEQPTNRYLKEIMQIAGIGKVITTHCARHTFGTLCRAKGISTDITAKFMGHKNTKITEVYIKHDDELLKSEIDRWNRPK